VQKLDIFGNKVLVNDSDGLYCKLCCNVISLATLAQWHREWKKYGRKKLQFSDRQLHKDYGCLEVQFAPKFSQNGRLLAPKQLKISQELRSIAKIARLHENAKVAQKLRSATSQFSGGTKSNKIWQTVMMTMGDNMKLGADSVHIMWTGLVSVTTVSQEVHSRHLKASSTWCRYWMIRLLSPWLGYEVIVSLKSQFML